MKLNDTFGFLVLWDFDDTLVLSLIEFAESFLDPALQ